MSFPEITTWANNAVALIQIAGIAVAGVCAAIIAVVLLTSFGSEHKIALVKSGMIGVAGGLALLIGAPKIAAIFLALANFMR